MPSEFWLQSTMHRRAFLGLCASAVGTELALSACSKHDKKSSIIAAYVPVWLDNAAYEQMTSRIAQTMSTLGRLYVSFATMNIAADVQPPVVSAALMDFLQHDDLKAALSMSLGGANVTADQWKTAQARGSAFGLAVRQAQQRLEDTLQQPIDIDVDCEAVLPATTVCDVVAAVRDSIPATREISIAVPPDKISQFDTSAAGLGNTVHTFNLMTYDQFGPWSKHAGPIASGSWVAATVRAWMDQAPHANTAIGFPSYGYVYPGTLQAGDQNQGRAYAIPYTDIPQRTIHDHTDQLTSEARVDGNWTSCISPSMIGQIATSTYRQYSAITETFFWSTYGLTDEHIQALT